MAVRVLGASAVNRRKNNSLLGIIFIGLCIVISSVIISRSFFRDQTPVKERVLVAEFDTVSLPVPAAPVPAGTRAKDIKFTYVKFPQHQIPEGAITDLGLISDSVTISPLPSHLPIFDSNFATSYSVSNPVIERIPSGMRAMTIRVDATSAVEGWAGSGAQVDVLLISKDRTSVVAEKVKILSAERSVSPVEGNAPNIPSTVTLLVSQEQCLAINTAIPLGKIAFALRSASDEEKWGDTLFTAERLKGGQVAKETSSAISGFVTIKGEQKKFALAEGKWIKTQSIPTGFLVNQEEDEKN